MHRYNQKASLLGWGLLFFLPSLLLYLSAFQSNAVDTDVQQAQNWFQQVHSSPKFLGHIVELNWNAARKVVHNGRKFYEVPLSGNTVFAFGMGNLDQDQNVDTTNTRVNGELTVVVAQDSTGYTAYYLQVSGTKNYVDTKGASKVLLTNFDQIQSDFTGIMEYFDMNGKHVDGWYFENGIANQLAFTFNSSNKSIATDRCLTCTTNITTWQITVSAGGYVNTYWEISGGTVICSAPTNFICYDPPFYPPGYYYYPWEVRGNNTNINPIEPLTGDCCKRLTNTQGLGIIMGLAYTIVASGFIYDIKCNIPSFMGQVELTNVNPDSPAPISWTFNQNNVTILSKGKLAQCGHIVLNRYRADIVFTFGYGNTPGGGTTISKTIEETRWVHLD